MSNNKSDTTAELVTLVLSLMIFPFSILWNGFVMAKLWLWFISQPFEVVEINTWHAAGITCIVRITTYVAKEINSEQSAYEWFAVAVMTAALYPAITLGVGAIVKAFAF